MYHGVTLREKKTSYVTYLGLWEPGVVADVLASVDYNNDEQKFFSSFQNST